MQRPHQGCPVQLPSHPPEPLFWSTRERADDGLDSEGSSMFLKVGEWSEQ